MEGAEFKPSEDREPHPCCVNGGRGVDTETNHERAQRNDICTNKTGGKKGKRKKERRLRAAIEKKGRGESVQMYPTYEKVKGHQGKRGQSAKGHNLESSTGRGGLGPFLSFTIRGRGVADREYEIGVRRGGGSAHGRNKRYKSHLRTGVRALEGEERPFSIRKVNTRYSGGESSYPEKERRGRFPKGVLDGGGTEKRDSRRGDGELCLHEKVGEEGERTSIVDFSF